LPELPDGAPIAVLAADLPGIDAAAVNRLSTALNAPASGDTELRGGAVLLDPNGRRQYLIGVWRRGALRDAIGRRPSWRDAALRDLLAPIGVVEVPGSDREAADIDTPTDLGRWQA
jgi:molybdopterin-guanine dinucleotide biosynthesis protein A